MNLKNNCVLCAWSLRNCLGYKNKIMMKWSYREVKEKTSGSKKKVRVWCRY